MCALYEPVCVTWLVTLVCPQNVVRSLFVKTLYIAPPALLPSEAEADTGDTASARASTAPVWWRAAHASKVCLETKE